jgi:hypothetical protein
MFILNTPQNHNENTFDKFEIFKNLELQNLTINHSFPHSSGRITIMQEQHDKVPIGLHCGNKKK